MSVLTRDELFQAMKEGRIEIEPFSEDMVGPGSVDLNLSNEFRIFKKLRRGVVVDDTMDLEKITRLVYREHSFTLLPGETILGITQERIRLAPNLCGWIQGRSRFARHWSSGAHDREFHSTGHKQPAGPRNQQHGPFSTYT